MMVQLLMNESFRQIIGRALKLGLREYECDSCSSAWLVGIEALLLQHVVASY